MRGFWSNTCGVSIYIHPKTPSSNDIVSTKRDIMRSIETLERGIAGYPPHCAPSTMKVWNSFARGDEIALPQ
jgi:hypothetical protein